MVRRIRTPKKNNAQEMDGHKHTGDCNFTKYQRNSVKIESINKWFGQLYSHMEKGKKWNYRSYQTSE